eukprot:71613-Chlamydomonas_euryale.AAC.2
MHKCLSPCCSYIAAHVHARAQDHDLPKSVDWRGTPVDQGVKDQGYCGSCWSFAATGAMEAAWCEEQRQPDIQTSTALDPVTCWPDTLEPVTCWPDTLEPVTCWPDTREPVTCWPDTLEPVMCWSGTREPVTCWPDTREPGALKPLSQIPQSLKP